MAKKASDKPSASAENALQQRKKQARLEAKLMQAIEEANKDLKKAQKKQAKAQALVETQSAQVQTLEAKMAELRAPGPQPEIVAPTQSAELEYQQVPSETGTSTSTDSEPAPSIVEEATISEVMVVTNEVTEGSEAAVVQNDEIAAATEPAPTPTAQTKVPAPKTVAARKSTTTKRPASPSTATKRPTSPSPTTKRPANRSQSTRQPHSDAE